jgi:hypothetical protein
MAINSKNDICNMALSHLGNYGTVNDIDTPTNDKETTFALWYDITRQATIKLLMPNFALARKTVAKIVTTPAFGFKIVYEYPNDCLKLLGIGDINEKDYNYAVEGNRIYTDYEWPDGLPVRYLKDIKDVNTMSPEFKVEFSFELAANVALPITQDPQKAALIIKQLPEKRASLSGLNAQENKPIRVSRSQFKQARYAFLRGVPNKR